MKLNTSLVAAALGLSMVGASQAGTVYMTGSTAFRSQVYAALTTPGRVFSSISTNFTREGSSASGANYMYIAGVLQNSGVQTAISCHWSGSEAGVANVADAGAQPLPSFIDPAIIPNGTANHVNAAPASSVTHAADLAFADNVQDYAKIYANNVNPPLPLNTGAPVGIIPFKWVRNNGHFTGTSVTSSQLRQALLGCRLSVLNGINASNTWVYVSGRDNESGTRVNAYGVAGFGLFTPPNQIKISSGGVMQDLDGFGTYFGDFGYTSGGTLAATMGANTKTSDDKAFEISPNTKGFSVLAYLGMSDATTAITAGATELAIDGVPFSVANIKEGTYPFFGVVHCYQANSFGDAQTPNVYGRLVTDGQVDLAIAEPNGIRLANMNCTKASPIADPVHP